MGLKNNLLFAKFFNMPVVVPSHVHGNAHSGDPFGVKPILQRQGAQPHERGFINSTKSTSDNSFAFQVTNPSRVSPTFGSNPPKGLPVRGNPPNNVIAGGSGGGQQTRGGSGGKPTRKTVDFFDISQPGTTNLKGAVHTNTSQHFGGLRG